MQSLGSFYVFKLVKIMFDKCIDAFTEQFMMSSMSWDMFGKNY